MPFGLTNSPATWQRLVDKLLSDELESHVFVYLDDMIIVTQTFDEHMRVLREVLERLHKAGLIINYEKCEFGRKELRYLGYLVGENGLQVDPGKVECIVNMPHPKSVSEVRRFIGMVAWYRRFIPSFSTLVAPITKLLKKNRKFQWSDECEEAFRNIKDKLISAPILTCPDFSLPFIVHTDASGYGIGAVLTQNISDSERVVAYLSRSLNKCERNYSTTERECLAVLWAVEKLRPYLEGTKFTVVTDHASLVWLQNLKDPTGRLARWAMRMQQHDFEIIHRKGKEHLLPDILSRTVPAIDCVKEKEVPKDKWHEKMKFKVEKYPDQYPDWKLVNESLFKHCLPRYPGLAFESDNWKQVVPKRERKDIIYQFHNTPTSGHCGTHKTYLRLCEKYYWPKMKADVASYIRKCITCQTTKPELKKTAGLMATRKIADKPWETICVDLIGPLPRSSRGYVYILTIVDQFSKFPMLFPLRSATAKNIIQSLEDSVFLLLGVPRNIICDNGPQFKSREFKKLCEDYGTTISYTAFYHPQANPAERTNQVIKAMLRAYVADNHRLWDSQLAKVACAIRTSTQESTKLTPYFVNFGKEMVINGRFHRPLSSKEIYDAEERSKILEAVRNDVKKRLEKVSQNNKRVYDLRRRDAEYKIHDLVWRKNYVLSDAAKYYNAKLAPKFIGPFKVIRIVSPWTYELCDESGKGQGIWHAKDLKPYTGTYDDD